MLHVSTQLCVKYTANRVVDYPWCSMYIGTTSEWLQYVCLICQQGCHGESCESYRWRNKSYSARTRHHDVRAVDSCNGWCSHVNFAYVLSIGCHLSGGCIFSWHQRFTLFWSFTYISLSIKRSRRAASRSRRNQYWPEWGEGKSKGIGAVAVTSTMH